MEHWTFGRKVGLGFMLAGIITAIVAIVGYRTTSGLVDDARAVSRTHQLRREASALIALVQDIETSARGFALTGNDDFLVPGREARPQLAASLGRVRELVRSSAGQSSRVDRIQPLIDAKLERADKLVAARKSNGLEVAASLTADGQGDQLMTELRDLIGELDREEVRLLERRKDEAEASADRASAVMLGGAIFGFLLVVALGWMITRSLSRQIGDAVRHVQSSSTELHAAASQQAAGSREQSTAMNEISTTISELLATSRQIAESAQRVAQIAADTAGAARAGTTTVDRAQESVTAIRKQVDQIVSHMLELGKNSQQIGAVLDIVTELAEQTNILAINATIEAAGAGEAGRRFAVVADEIRKLADRVGSSTKEIRGMIDTVRSAVNTTVMATETGSKAVDAGGKQFGEVAASFRQIAGQVGTTTEAAREIELSTKQQATAVEQVNVAIANVGQATRETEASSTQTLETASQLSKLSKDLLRVVQATA